MKRNALLSVSDKTGIHEFAWGLHELGFALMSTGGTHAELTRQGHLPVRSVEEYTGSPEVMDGQVKTLHPRVAGGILAREKHVDDLLTIGGEFIEVVAITLYPFAQVAARKDATEDEIIASIDIGGFTALRGAAKNFKRVLAICQPYDYDRALEALRRGGEYAARVRLEFAAEVFLRATEYDAAISKWLGERMRR